MHAIILVGGLGTRLQSVVAGVPKPMAPIHGKPFLAYLLDYLQTQGVTRVTFSVHYLREQIQRFFQTCYNDIAIDYAVEEKLLGTGGAIAYALSFLPDKQPVLVLNGDTFLKLNYRALFQAHQQNGAVLTMALRSVADCHRYGKVLTENDTIVGFREKGCEGPGLINAGVYVMDPSLLQRYPYPTPFSFERDVLLNHIAELKPKAFITKDYFIDIGIPEDYARAQQELPPPLPKISVVIVVKNRKQTIEKALHSVIDQQYPNVELIVIDGASTDNTVEIIKRYANHLAYWHSRPDGGALEAINLGIEKATGDLVATLMSDDWYEPGTLQKIAAAYVAHPDADMLTCGGRIVYYDANTQTYKTQWVFATARSLKLSFYNICFAASAVCCRFVKKSFYERIGLYMLRDTRGNPIFGSDKELLMRAILFNAKDIFVNHLGLNYFANPDSSTFGNNRKNIILLCEQHLEIADMYLQKPELTFKQRLCLHYWYADQTVRLMLYYLLGKNFPAAWNAISKGVRKYTLAWPVAAITTIGTIFCKRTWRLVLKSIK